MAHVACLAAVAARTAGEAHKGWHECSTCGQEYTGAVDLGLKRVLVRRMRRRPSDDHSRLAAEGNLGTALSRAGKHHHAAVVLGGVLTAMKRVHGEDDVSTLNTANWLAATTHPPSHFSMDPRQDRGATLAVLLCAEARLSTARDHHAQQSAAQAQCRGTKNRVGSPRPRSFKAGCWLSRVPTWAGLPKRGGCKLR